MHAFKHQAIWQRCQLALYVSSWLLGARARRLLAQSRELIALIISSLTCITNVPTRLGWNPVVQQKGQDNEVFEMAWFLCASSSRSDIAAMRRSPQNLVAKDSSIRALVKANVEDLCPESFRGHKAPSS